MSCTTIQVQSGDSCASLATRCGISAADFTKYNPSHTLCSTLVPGEHVCCSSGTLPDFAPKPYSNGTCHTYYVQSGDTCSSIAATWDITVHDINSYNNQTWGWLGCADLDAHMNICLSTGTPPFPASSTTAVCGPQVNGTTEPTNKTDWALLNPCPLNACCDIWGQCGITPEFCTVTKSATGAPGTAAAGTNGCISNCGIDYSGEDAPDDFLSIGYFEAFNKERSCLNMYPESIDTSQYTHIYYAFGEITSNYTIQISDGDIFNQFLMLKDVKRVVSFGGWAFSTDPSTYTILRDAVKEVNRDMFIAHIMDFVAQTGVDGVDFDWEYPGEPDIPGIPAGSSEDGANYLAFLKTLKNALSGSSSTVSIAAPASYWYLKAFPIKEIAETVDWIVYMTYDLHGTWDAGDAYAQDGCPSGKCLRSDVNLTETKYSLSMITKAGVPSNKIMVGVTSYGRSFEMTKAGCTTPDCTWTAGGAKGPCTDTEGYIANAEINQVLMENPTASTSLDSESNSDIMVYNQTQWVGYMSSSTKKSRKDLYRSWNYGGSTDWAVDLQSYITVPLYPLTSYLNGDGGTFIPPTCLHKNSSSWRCIDCNNATAVVDAATYEEEWTAALADDAMHDAISWYTSITNGSQNIPHDPSSWSSYIAYYLGYSGSWDCTITPSPSSCDDDMACQSYETGVPVALSVIATTMSRMRNFYNTWWTSLEYAKNDLGSDTSDFKSTFAPDIEDTLGEEIAKWLTDQILGAVGGGIWKTVSAGIDKLLGDAVASSTKDQVSGYWDGIWDAVVGNVDDAMDSTPTVPSLDDIQSYLSNLVNLQMNAVEQVFNETFNGSDASQEHFKSSASNGTWLYVDNSNMPSVLQTVKQQLMANLLSFAWNVTDYYQPVIVTTDVQDDTSNPFVTDEGSYELSDSDAENARYSIPGSGKTFWLVAGNICQEWSTHFGGGTPLCNSPDDKFRALPGITQLNGTASEWGNLHYSALIESAYAGYVLNGNANGYNISNNPDGGYITASDGTKSVVPWSAGVSTPGVFEVPICNYTMAELTVTAVSWVEGATSPKCATFPCCSCEELDNCPVE